MHSVTDVYFCQDRNEISWASSGESCCVCRVLVTERTDEDEKAAEEQAKADWEEFLKYNPELAAKIEKCVVPVLSCVGCCLSVALRRGILDRESWCG